MSKNESRTDSRLRVVGIIPARGGSKGIPRKNLSLIGGLTLVERACRTALASDRLEGVMVSTDDQEIAAIAVEAGAEAPFLRPPEIAGDEVPMLPVLQHALDWLESERRAVDALALLQPTSPLRTVEDIDGAWDLFTTRGAESVVSVVRVPHNFDPHSQYVLKNDALEPFIHSETQTFDRNAKPETWARNGPAILITRSEVLRSGRLYGRPTLGYRMPLARSFDIDDQEDLELIRAIWAASPGTKG